MAPSVSVSKIRLSIPPYACDFDPLDSTRLIIGGGGGASRTGVGNKIIVLDASNPVELSVSVEFELSTNEDNPTSLAVGLNHLIYAGINSSPEDIQKGLNQHLRVFEIETILEEEKEKKEAVISKSQFNRLKILEKSKCSLFSEKKKDTYQRITRLSGAYPEHRSQLGAIATGLAQKHEIALFETVGPDPPVVRYILSIEKEAVDLDIFQTFEKEFVLVFCHEDRILTKGIMPKTDDEKPQCRYVVSRSVNNEKASVPSLRAVRWLIKDHIIALFNLPRNSGVTLKIIAFSPRGTTKSQVIQSVHLPRRLKKATGLCITKLTSTESPMDVQDYTQFVIAVAGHDRSLHLFTVDLKLKAGISSLSSINPFRTFHNVHPLQITSLAFSNSCHSKCSTKSNSVPPPPLRLASVGISNTVVVLTLPLFPVPLSSNKRGHSKNVRYVVVLPSRTKSQNILISISIMSILLIAIIIRGILGK